MTISIPKMDHTRYINSIFNENGDTYGEDFSEFLDTIWNYTFDLVNNGIYRTASWSVTGTNGSKFTRALHKSPRHEGLQSSYYEVTKTGEIIPISHNDFKTYADMNTADKVNGITINFK